MKKYYLILLKKLTQQKIKEDEQLIRIKQALYEVKRARNNFDMVVGADNVELAILELNAAEKRYRNLLKEIKEQRSCGMENDIISYNLKAVPE